jgi:hypothetical protein
LLLRLSSNYLIYEGRCAFELGEEREERIFNSCKVKVKVNAKMKLSLFTP